MTDAQDKKQPNRKDYLIITSVCIIASFFITWAVIDIVVHDPGSVPFFVLFFGSAAVLIAIFGLTGIWYWLSGWLIATGLILVIFVSWILFLPLMIGIVMLYIPVKNMISSKKDSIQEEQTPNPPDE